MDLARSAIFLFAAFFCSSGVAAGIAEERNATVNETLAANLSKCDTLNFTVFTNQKWERLQEFCSKDIRVTWPDGHQTVGIEKLAEDLKAMFAYAPDTRIKHHSLRFGDGTGAWTTVSGVMEGTFSKPMRLGKGKKAIKPTGKTFKIPMCAIGHWKDGVLIEEFLFWDNLTFWKQIGLGK
jgi:hypothetical protein